MENNIQPTVELTRKERRELKRKEETNPQNAGNKKIKLSTIRNWGICIVFVGLVTWGLIAASKKQLLPALLGTSYPTQGQQHIAIGASHADYNSNPPTSGPHYERPANWGIYQTELPDEQLVHNLEHGGIWISYSNISTTTKADLEKIANSNTKIILEPRAKDGAPIILASWGQLQKLEAFDEQTILNFIQINKSRSPEPFAN